MNVYTTVESPLGELTLTGKRTAAGIVLTAVAFGRVRAEGRRVPFAEAERQLAEYFAGARTGFDLAVASHGTPFQERVWAAMSEIPYGATTTYGQLAARVGAPRDRIRAVGAAVGANPLLVVRPCHRVVGADGALTGYAGGVERKEALLELEGALQPLFGREAIR
jgi:methylated-DNA-[protein]-cysteine S-methyltransferase